MPDALDASLQGLSPVTLWRLFDELRKIPRPSLSEEKVRGFLGRLAREQGWEFQTDAAGNCLIRVAGRGAGVKSAPLALQGHMDMVCEKRREVVHDFERDPIKLQRVTREVDGVEREVLMAQGTTLGADNGIGVAAALALALAPDLDHPPLELLMTANEESGMSGAAELDGSMITAKRMLNLDAEEHGSIYLSCAGGRDLVGSWEIQRDPIGHDDVPLRIRVGGLKGGHSGVDIHLRRANAIKLLIGALSDERVELDGVRIAALHGGGRDNVIPRTAEAKVWCVETRVETLRKQLAEVAAEMSRELSEDDPDVTLVVEEIEISECAPPLSAPLARCIVKVMGKIPDGVLAWSEAIDGLVETSSNLGIVRTNEETLEIICLTRSSKRGVIESVQERIERALEAAGGSVAYENPYPGWEANTDSALLKQAIASYAKLFDEKPALKAIHAGLECGILGDRIPGIEMIAFGPDLRDVHTPNEMLVLKTIPPFWEFLRTLVADLC
jgi:dipeptidase D